MADLHQINAGENRVLNLKDGAVVCLLLQQVAGGTKIDGGIRNNLLSDGINGRIRHLCKKLLEIAEQGLPGFRQHGQRDIRTHGGNRFRTAARHGKNLVLDFFIGITEGFVEFVPELLRVLFHLQVGNGQILQMNQVRIQPFTIGTLRGIAALQFIITDQTLCFRVHQQHLSGLETGLFHNVCGIDVQNTNFGREDHVVVFRLIPAAGAQSVAVQHCADAVAVAEDNCRRTIPGLHHGGIVEIKVLLLLTHLAVVGPGLRDGHHYGLRKLYSVHHQEFQGVVQHGGVGALLIHHRENAVHVLIADDPGMHGLLAGEHPVNVAADRVDLAVVHDVAVRVGPFPAWICVG